MTWNGREEEAERQLFDAEDGRLCRLAGAPRGPMVRKFAENPRDSKSDAPRMHTYALKEGDRSRIIISSRRSAVFLAIHISFHERIFVRLDSVTIEMERERERAKEKEKKKEKKIYIVRYQKII